MKPYPLSTSEQPTPDREQLVLGLSETAPTIQRDMRAGELIHAAHLNAALPDDGALISNLTLEQIMLGACFRFIYLLVLSE